MKRFIDLRGVIFGDDDLPLEQREPCFAFYCTVTDQFEMLGGVQTWTSYEDFRDDYALEHGNLDAGFDRLVRLMPAWARAIKLDADLASELGSSLPK